MICEVVNDGHAVGLAVHIEDRMHKSGLELAVQLKNLGENREKIKPRTEYVAAREGNFSKS
jgi:hypothetical protein